MRGNIFLVEDSATQPLELKQILEDNGAFVDFAQDGSDGDVRRFKTVPARRQRWHR